MEGKGGRGMEGRRALILGALFSLEELIFRFVSTVAIGKPGGVVYESFHKEPAVSSRPSSDVFDPSRAISHPAFECIKK